MIEDYIQYAYDSNKNKVKIIDAIKGDKYYCNCGGELIVKAGKIKIKHFAHKFNSICNRESWIHKECKNILLKNKKINYFDKQLNKVVLLEFDDVILEKAINDFRPDAIGYKDGKQYAIEFRYTHKIDNYKRNKIKLANIFCIEVYTYFFNLDNIQNELENNINNKTIIYNPFYTIDEEIRLAIKDYISKLKKSNEIISELENEINIKNKQINELKNEVRKINQLLLEAEIEAQSKELIYTHKEELINAIIYNQTQIQCEYYKQLDNGLHLFKNPILDIIIAVSEDTSIIYFNKFEKK